MSSSTVAQHASQPLNFGPEWLRALSTPDSATSVPSSSGSGNIFKFSATKYRYSKEEILALRANVSDRLSENVKNEIIENLKDVESVFRSTAMEPLSLTAPTSEESAKLSALSSYISGRTPGGAGRGGHSSQQSQPDSRGGRGGSSASNTRGGSRGRGGRDHNYGSNRTSSNNNNSDDNGENGNNNSDEPSSSWSRGNFHTRGGSFTGRMRSYDDREQSQTFRRGGGGMSTRQTSEVWRRSRGDDDENNQQGEDSSPVNGSTSWTSRGGQSRRGAGNGSMEQRTKSNEKWASNDDRSGQSNNYESNQQRGSGWRTNSSTSDRDLSSRRPPPKRDRMPEWMDDGNDDNQLSNATFEQDGTFTRSSSIQPNNSNEQLQTQSQPSSEESLSQTNTDSSRPKEEIPSEKPVQKAETTVVNPPVASEPIVSQPTPPVQQFLPAWDDDFDHSDLATTVVEATLADDHDYSPPISSNPTPRIISTEPTPSNMPIIPQQRPPVIIDDKQWFYKDPQNTVQGPFSSADMERWFNAGYFTVHLPVKRMGETQFSSIQHLTQELGRLPFRTDVSSLPTTPVQKQQQQSMVSESQKFNPASATSSNAFLEDYLLQQSQLRQNMQHSLMFNRQASMPLSTNERKPVSSSSNISSQLSAYMNSQQQQQQPVSQMFSSDMSNDPSRLYQQQVQRSLSSTQQQQQQSNPLLYDEMQRSFRNLSSQPSNNSSLFSSNMSVSQQQQQTNDILARLSQAMQTHGKQQQDKVEEQRRIEQKRREMEIERLRLFQQAEQQMRLQREEEERRQYEQELRRKQEINNNRQMMFDQLAKTMDNKKQSNIDMDPFLAFQQSILYQKEQQAKLEAQQAENIRRYQEKYREQPMYKISESNNWNRHSSQTNESAQSYNLAELQKQEQERRSREAAALAHQYAKSQTLPIQNSATSSSSVNKTGSWAQTLFAGSNSGNSNVSSISNPMMSDHNTNENPLTDSASIAAYNQQATNAPKSRSTTNQQSSSWNTPSNVSHTSIQDIQRQQQIQNEAIQLQQSHNITSGHSSTPVWTGNVQQQTIPSQQTSSLFWTNQNSSSSNKPVTTNPNTKPSTPWTELKPASPSSTITPEKINPTHEETTKTDNEAKLIVKTNRTQDALSRWTQAQFKDSLKDVDVPTLVQLLKDIDNAADIIEYVQPYIGTVSKAKEFANDFLIKRKQLANAEPDLDNERLNELVMAPTSNNDDSGNGGDEGFQLASSNGQKKKAKKMKGQKLDGKQLGFVVNNRPEQREDIDKVPI